MGNSAGSGPFGRQAIVPHRISRPIQLLAAWLVTLVLIEGGFLTGAANIAKPSWASALLVVSAVAAVPLFIASLFVLLTRYRPQMQDDRYYAPYVREEQRLELTRRLHQTMQTYDLDLTSIAFGRSINDVPAQGQGEIRHLTASLQGATRPVHTQDGLTQPDPDPRALLELGKSLMAEGDWVQAAKYFDEYVRVVPDDWLAHFSRGVAHANARLGTESNLAALRAYNDAIALAPADAGPDLMARAYAYRAGIYKRLGRLPEAEADVNLGESLASDPDIRADLLYSRACIYAMTGRREQTIQAVRDLSGTRQIRAIPGHLEDYFRSLRGDPEFLSVLREAGAVSIPNIPPPI
jgi:tetratricopeptide (TPR) repeat protein